MISFENSKMFLRALQHEECYGRSFPTRHDNNKQKAVVLDGSDFMHQPGVFPDNIGEAGTLVVMGQGWVRHFAGLFCDALQGLQRNCDMKNDILSATINDTLKDKIVTPVCRHDDRRANRQVGFHSCYSHVSVINPPPPPLTGVGFF